MERIIEMVTKDKFIRFVRIKNEGQINLWDKKVEEICSLSTADHFDVIKYYDVYIRLFKIDPNNLPDDPVCDLNNCYAMLKRAVSHA